MKFLSTASKSTLAALLITASVQVNANQSVDWNTGQPDAHPDSIATGNGFAGWAAYQWRMNVDIDGLAATLLLNESTLLQQLNVHPSTYFSTPGSLRAYSGTVQGHENSWARITIFSSRVHGMVSLDGQISEIKHFLTDSTSDSIEPAPGQLIATTTDAETPESINLSSGIEQSNQPKTTVHAIAPIGVVVDSSFDAYYNGNGLEQALTILNNVDGIYQEQLGIAIQPTVAILLDQTASNTMNLRYASLETAMRTFRQYRLDSPELSQVNLSVSTLFSGNLSNTMSGLAWIGGACHQEGYDVNVVTPYEYPTRLTAQILGNSLGASKDDGYACAGQHQSLMWGSHSDRTSATFTSCNVESIYQAMKRNYCYTPAIDLAIDINNDPSGHMTLTALNRNTELSAPGASILIQGTGTELVNPTAGCVMPNEQSIECAVGSLLPLQSIDYSFTFTEADTADATLSITLEPDGFLDHYSLNNSLHTRIEFKPAIEPEPESGPESPIDTVQESSNRDNIPEQGSGSLDINTALILILLAAFNGRLTTGNPKRQQRR